MYIVRFGYVRYVVVWQMLRAWERVVSLLNVVAWLMMDRMTLTATQG